MVGWKAFLAWLVTIVLVKEVTSTGHSRAAIDKPHSEKFEYKIVHGHHGPVRGHSYANGYGGFGANGHGGVIGDHLRHGAGTDHNFVQDNKYRLIDHGGHDHHGPVRGHSYATGYGGFGANGHGGVIGDHLRHGAGTDHNFVQDNKYRVIDHGGHGSYGHGSGDHFNDYSGNDDSGAHSLHDFSAHGGDYDYNDEEHSNEDELEDESVHDESNGEFNYKVLGYGDFIDLDDHKNDDFNGKFPGGKSLGDYGKFDWKDKGNDFDDSYGLGYGKYEKGNSVEYGRYGEYPYKFNGYGNFKGGYWKGHEGYEDYDKGYGGYGGHNYGGYGKRFGGFGRNGLYDKGSLGSFGHGYGSYGKNLGPYSYGYGKDGYNVPKYNSYGVGYGHGGYGKGLGYGHDEYGNGYGYGTYGKGYGIDGVNHGGYKYSSPQKGWSYKYGEYGYASESDSYNDHNNDSH